MVYFHDETLVLLHKKQFATLWCLSSLQSVNAAITMSWYHFMYTNSYQAGTKQGDNGIHDS